MKRILLIWVCAFCASGMPVLADQAIDPTPLHALWEIDLNGSAVKLKFDRTGVPASLKKRVNQFTIQTDRGGKEKILFHVSSDATQDITLSGNWIFRVTDGVSKDVLVIVLRESRDGEDPSIKPIFIVTDGCRVASKMSGINEKPESWLTQVKTLLREFGVAEPSGRLAEFILENQRGSQQGVK